MTLIPSFLQSQHQRPLSQQCPRIVAKLAQTFPILLMDQIKVWKKKKISRRKVKKVSKVSKIWMLIFSWWWELLGKMKKAGLLLRKRKKDSERKREKRKKERKREEEEKNEGKESDDESKKARKINGLFIHRVLFESFSLSLSLSHFNFQSCSLKRINFPSFSSFLLPFSLSFFLSSFFLFFSPYSIRSLSLSSYLFLVTKRYSMNKNYFLCILSSNNFPLILREKREGREKEREE